MKWLILLPIWVFFLSYATHRLKKGAGDVGPAPGVAKTLAEPAADPGGARAPAPPRPRAGLLSGAEIDAAARGFLDRVELLPTASGRAPLSPLWQGSVGTSSATAPRFAQWRLFEGEHVSFYYPAEEGFSVVTVTGDRAPSMFGSVFLQRDQKPDRWHCVVAPDGVTWGAVTVDTAATFDRVERYPSGESFHKLLEAGGGLARVSLGSDGSVARVQLLGDGVRISLLGWQHCAAHREAYAAFAVSLQLAQGRRNIARLVRGEAGGFPARLGLLERGLDAKGIRTVLGRPTGIAGDTWVYEAGEGDSARVYRIHLEGGVFRGLREDWRVVRKDPPIRGSIAWMTEKTEVRAGNAGGIGYDIGRLKDEDVEFIFAEMERRLPSAVGAEWLDLCRVLANLGELRLEQDRCMEIVARRFLTIDPPGTPAISILQAWDPARARALFVRRATELVQRRFAQSGRADELAGELRTLLAYIGKSHPEVGAIVASAAGHAQPAFREIGFSYWKWMPEGERAPLLRAGVIDRNPRVRRRSAEALASHHGFEAGDRELLEECMRNERDAETREHLSRSIRQLAIVPASD